MSDCLCLFCKKENTDSIPNNLNAQSKKRRTLLVEIIKKNPGIKFRDIMRQTKLKNGVLSHYLRKLEKTESVKVERLPRQTRFFPVGFSDEESKIVKALWKKTPQDIICTLISSDNHKKQSLHFSKIVANVSKSPSTVSTCLSQLIQDGIITVAMDFGRQKKYHLSNRHLVCSLIEDYKPRMFERTVSGFEEIISSL